MKKLSLLLGAVMIAVGSLVSAPTKQASADQSWSSEVLVSSAQVRFEAQASGYDSATNKYKYKFSWLMPKGKTYSFKIDGNMYQSSVTQNAVIETPYWFSPDITYTIQIYPLANGKGTMVAQGTFKAPSAAKSSLTEEEQYESFIQYLYELPEYKLKKVSSPSDVAGIVDLLDKTSNIETVSELTPYLSKDSVEVLNQYPAIMNEMDNPGSTVTDLTKYSRNGIKIVDGKQYAYIKQTFRNKDTKKKYNSDMVFIKEDGQWKFDYLQTFRSVFEALGIMEK